MNTPTINILLSIHHRLELLLNLPYDKLHAMALQSSARELAHQ
jgi:hypothetical protein